MFDSFFGDGAFWFSIPAIIATLVFSVRLILSFLGSTFDLGVGALDIDPTDLDALHADPSELFQWLSVQSLIAFVMGFGWGGLAAYRGSDLSPLLSVVVGVGVGLAMVWVLGAILKAVYRLQVTGNISPESTVGIEGQVYVSVPTADAAKATGLGKVRVVIDRRQRVYNAVSDGDEIPTHARVRVLRVNPDNSLTVSRIQA